MLDLLDRARDHLEAAGFPNVVAKRLDAFTGDDGVILTFVDFDVRETYYDGTQRGDYSLAITTRRLAPLSGIYESAEEEAKDLCLAAAEELQGRVLVSADKSFRQDGGLRVTGIPVSISSPDRDKAYMWQCKLTADIETRSI